MLDPFPSFSDRKQIEKPLNFPSCIHCVNGNGGEQLKKLDRKERIRKLSFILEFKIESTNLCRPEKKGTVDIDLFLQLAHIKHEILF